VQKRNLLQFFCTPYNGVGLTLRQEMPMASLQKKSDSYYCQFMYHGKRHTFTVGEVEKSEAQNKARQVDYLLMRLKQKLIVLPDGTDIVTFIEHEEANQRAANNQTGSHDLTAA
jgi:hypothetical protein